MMTPEHARRGFIARNTDAVVAVPYGEDGDLVHYFVDDGAPATDEDMQAALSAIGSCSDLDWDEWAAELDRIRQESKPTPAIDL